MAANNWAGARKRIVILGGGFGGAYCAKEFAHLLRSGEAEVTLIDRNNYLLFYPLLVEAGVGAIEARHVVIPTRKFLPKNFDFKMAEVLGADLKTQQVTYQVIGCDRPETIHYDHLIFALGSVTKVPPIPGLREHGFELKALVDAIELRDRGIRLLELANTIPDPEMRRDLLTFVVVGANYTGVELAGEYHAFLQEATEAYPNLDASEIQMVVLEYADRILGGTSEKLARWCRETLEKRGVRIDTNNTIKEVGEDYTITAKGERIPTRTVVWAAGIAPSPMVKGIGLPTNEKGYVPCDQELRVKDVPNVWAIGDSATVFNEQNRPYVANAQVASREGPHCARNVVAAIRGEQPKPFDFQLLGSFAAIGRKQAAANVLGRDLTGFLGWVLYRGTYLMKMPTLGMKARLIADWMTELVFRNEPVQLGVHRPIPQPNAPRTGDPGNAEPVRSEMPQAFVR